MPACAFYGNRLARAFGVGRDEARAVALLTKSCDQGVPAGCTNLAALFFEGRGVAKDAARAAALMSKSCDGGDRTGCANLGRFLAEGSGVPRDGARAVALLTRECEARYAQACVELGRVLWGGKGVRKDEGRAAAAFARGCGLSMERGNEACSAYYSATARSHPCSPEALACDDTRLAKTHVCNQDERWACLGRGESMARACAGQNLDACAETLRSSAGPRRAVVKAP